eukprot:5037208-Pleurochrysis_carterae.AAC.2
MPPMILAPKGGLSPTTSVLVTPPAALAIHPACSRRRAAQVAEALHKHGGLLLYDDSKASAELCEMARAGDVNGVRLLLNGGASINAADYDGRRAARTQRARGPQLCAHR